MPRFYITTTLPYVNAKPHLGHALEFIQADVIARWHRLLGDEVFFNVGTDEHGAKIYEKALEEKLEPQIYCDKYAAKFQLLKEKFNLSYDNFIRTTDEHHIMAAREFWQKCAANGDIYRKKYKTRYCVGCELEKTDSDLVNGKCPEHPNRELEIREEENYFFRFSKYQDKLLDLYKNNPDLVTPPLRAREIVSFVSQGLQDFSISRLKHKMPWGIAVPGDSNQVMYVWFDALINYISAIGWPDDINRFKQWWPGYQIAGKDNLRQQSAMWQAMLMSAGLTPSKQIFIHGFITGEGGIKMSKTLGNVVDPIEVVNKYGIDPVRYYLLGAAHPFEDSDFTDIKFKEKYTSDLANSLGNLVSRLTNLIEKNNLQLKLHQGDVQRKDKKFMDLFKQIDLKMRLYRFDEALSLLWRQLANNDEIITRTTPWKMVDKQELTDVLTPIAQNILDVAVLLQPFMPETAGKIINNFSLTKIKKSEILFPRI